MLSAATVGKHLETLLCVIDCRFPDEFVAGHIRGAHNFPPSTSAACLEFLLQRVSDEFEHNAGRRQAVVLHCEYSQVRAPQMAAFLLRSFSSDSARMPEIYVLQGGYAEFFPKFPQLCQGGYQQMHATTSSSLLPH
jgi:rhodanese-related sulfurtransferase